MMVHKPAPTLRNKLILFLAPILALMGIGIASITGVDTGGFKPLGLLESGTGITPDVPPAYATEEADIANNFNLDDYVTDNVGWLTGCTTGVEAECTPEIIPGSNGGDEFSFRHFCEPGPLTYDDPILYPGEEGASHLHQNYGNTGVNYASTYTSLRTTGESTCQGGKVNRSAYWHAAVLQDGVDIGNGPETVARKPSGTIVYYKVNRENVPTTVRFARGFNEIFGFNLTTGIRERGFRGWYCTDTGATAYYLANYDGTAAFTCPSTSKIEMKFESPGCWNGTDITTANGRDHVAFQVSGAHNAACPPTHPYKIIHFTFRVFFDHDGPDDYRTWYLSSDRMPGYPVYRNGETAHTDFYPAWPMGTAASPGVMITFMNKCNGLDGLGGRSCFASQLGDNRRLCDRQVGADCPASDIIQQSTLTALAGPARYQALPDDPAPGEVDPVAGFKSGSRVRRHRH